MLLLFGAVVLAADLGQGLSLDGAVGATWEPVVGKEADLTAQDPVGAPGVRVAQGALELNAEGPVGSTALVRVEEGIFHAGALEAAEARVGWRAPGSFGDLYLGRTDLPGTRDRDMEPEQQIFAIRPLLGRVSLPAHATGVGAALRYPNRAELRGGLSYLSATSDAPYRWARLRLSPLGALPEREDEGVQSIRIEASAGWLNLDSPALGELRLLDASLGLRWRFLGLDGEGIWLTPPAGQARQEWVLGLQSLLSPLPKGCDLHLALRGERVRGIIEGEDVRWLSAMRLAFRAPDARFVAYAQMLLSREQGSGVAPGEDVVALARGVERENDLYGIGALYRF